MLTRDLPRVQPHDLEAEQAVLGAVLLSPSTLPLAQELLARDDFYNGRHRIIFDALADLAGQNEGIDLVTVGDWIECKHQLEMIGGRSALAELLTIVGSAANIEHHARIVRDCAIRRHLIRFAADITQGAYDKAPTMDLLQEAERQLFRLSCGRDENAWCSLAEISREVTSHVDHLSKCTNETIGIPTGFSSLDTLFGGWQRSDLIILAARPSMGKTSLALGSALAAAKAGYRVGVLSLEMSRRQLGIRLHGMGAPIDVHALRTGKLSHQGWWHFAEAAQRLETLPFWIDDSSVLTVEQVAAKARHLKAREGLDLLIVDYIQLLHIPRADSRQQGIADASRKLKLLAKELDIPVLALSQLSRDCERRTDPRPVLADLRDSGAIEQDADVVLFLYREEAYRPETEEKGIAEILVRKHRNGPIGDRRLRFVDRFAKFEDLPTD
ncbi:MAG: replicative DNA helicase [Nitrospira sp. CR1.1]|jgi:replicative DNA helicase|nr:replicative DNA helicase [Nitrospira sp. CR1.1]